MFFDKEYPATHSMSTAWYVADEDGNVAIIDYDDNGPVPWGTEETCIENLIYGNEDNSTELQIALTDDQIDELMENPHRPDEENMWYYDCIIQIDRNQESVFLELAKRKDFEIEYCLSKERGLYQIDAFDCLDEETNKVLKESTLQEMLNKGMICTVYKLKNMDTNSIWKDGHILFEKGFDNLPYYIYCQPYWTSSLPERMNIPKNPVKLSQIPEQLRKRIPILPFKFSEQKSFQVAEWIPCNFHGGEIVEVIDGFEYTLTIMTDGSEAFVLTGLDAGDYMNYCSEREKYHCTECNPWNNCHTDFANQRSSQPTVMFIKSPLERVAYSERIKSDIIHSNSISLSFIRRVPYKTENYMTSEELRKIVSDKMLGEYFFHSSSYLEDIIDRLKPNVLILDEVSFVVIGLKYVFDNHRVRIRGISYPVYKRSEIDTYLNDIEELAQKPYKGKVMPQVISKEEIENKKGRSYD